MSLSNSIFTTRLGNKVIYSHRVREAVKELKEMVMSDLYGKIRLEKYYELFDKIEGIFGEELV